jgi:pimeloyl-ACP methyl ester carboxylesterase
MPATIVLVHGAWHGAWCWDRVVAGLTARGIDAIAVDLPGHGASRQPLGDLHGDAAAVGGVLDALDGPAVVCGNSYGGAVISEGAAGHPNVRHLVYLAALMPEAGESCATSIPAPPNDVAVSVTELGPAMQFSDDGVTVDVDPVLGRGVFYADCTDVDVDWAVARLGPHPAIALQQPIPVAAWRTVPSTYVVCADDRAIAPWIQRALAARATHSVEWPTSHSPFLSQPDLVVDLLAGLAADVDDRA